MKIFKVKSECLICNKKFDWNQVIIIKAPEGACFCLDCCDTFDDNTVYDKDKGDCWITYEYQGNETFKLKQENKK